MDWLSDLDEAAVSFTNQLGRWYEHHKRDLPWRHTQDPYYIWLSEVILQQTRVAQGMPYYHRFVQTFPTIQDLARADERELLRLWQGLGYYSRARNLHQTARFIVDELNGQFPRTYHDLLQLRGIGVYTAAAIASFAFGEKVAVVDGNVYRVLARIFDIQEDITTTGAKKTFSVLANKLIGATDGPTSVSPATFNQAMMEFGAIQCTPVAPDCLLCPFQERCRAYLTGRQSKLPVKSKKAAVRERYFNYIVIEQRDAQGDPCVAMKERSQKDIWQHLYDFQLIETDEPVESFRELPDDEIRHWIVQEGVMKGLDGDQTQLLSHQRIRARFWRVEVPAGKDVQLPAGLKFYKLSETEPLPKPLLINSYLKNGLF